MRLLDFEFKRKNTRSDCASDFLQCGVAQKTQSRAEN
jgi:hypothetical protein